VEADSAAINDLAYENGWTDGLPVIPPTEERVAAMIEPAGRARDEIVGILGPRLGEATIELLAVNAVMAGCRPEYFPVVVAAIEALAQPDTNLFGANTTTNPGVPLLILNGPVARDLDVNAGYCLLGPGNRANATIGRAISLLMINVAGRIPGDVCKSTHQHPGAYTMCFAEYEEKSPWEPLHVERGLDRADSAVTVLFPSGTTNVLHHRSTDADEILTTLAGSMQAVGSNHAYPDYGLAEMLVLLCPDHAAFLARSFTKRQVQEELMRRTSSIPLASFAPSIQAELLEGSNGQVEGDRVRLAARPEQFLLAVGGGLGGYYSVFLPTMGPIPAVTRRIDWPPKPAASAVPPSLARVEQGLAVIARALEADGYRLHVERADGRLGVRIEALAGACEDCLSPPSVLAPVLSTALDGLYGPDQIDITYPAGEGG
jgi:hypothetical protein